MIHTSRCHVKRDDPRCYVASLLLPDGGIRWVERVMISEEQPVRSSGERRIPRKESAGPLHFPFRPVDSIPPDPHGRKLIVRLA